MSEDCFIEGAPCVGLAKTYGRLWSANFRIKQLEDAAEVAANQIKLMAELHSKRTLEEHKRVLELEAAIRKTLDENRHLADGEDCTLRELKNALPEWN